MKGKGIKDAEVLPLRPRRHAPPPRACLRHSLDELSCKCELPHTSRPMPELFYRAWVRIATGLTECISDDRHQGPGEPLHNRGDGIARVALGSRVALGYCLEELIDRHRRKYKLRPLLEGLRRSPSSASCGVRARLKHGIIRSARGDCRRGHYDCLQTA